MPVPPWTQWPRWTRSSEPNMANAPQQTKTPQNVKNLGDVEFTVEAARTVPDGMHTGKIVKAELVERGEEGFRYLDLHIEDGASGVELKCGFAASKLSPETGLGRLLSRFGAPIAEGNNVRPLAVLNKPGTMVAFETETERNKNGRFARVLPETVRPAQ